MSIKYFIRHIELLVLYLIQFLKVRMSFKGDFIVGTFVSICYHSITIYTISVMFGKTPSLNGWKKEEIFFIYALCAIPFDIFSMLFTNLFRLGNNYIIEGEMDRLLLRPIDPLLQLFMERINLEKFFGVIIGFIILFYASGRLSISWTFINIIYLIISLVSGITIYAGVFTTIGSLSFWMPDRTGIVPTAWNLVAFGRYPVDIYNPFLRFIISFVIPFAFVGFFPASQIMGHYEFRNIALLTPLVACICAVIGYTVWSMGLRKYESAGN